MGLLAGVAIKAINSSTKTFFGMWKDRNWHTQKGVLLLKKKRERLEQTRITLGARAGCGRTCFQQRQRKKGGGEEEEKS